MKNYKDDCCFFDDCKPVCAPFPKPVPCVPNVPTVLEGQSLYEAMGHLTKQVNVCIDTYNDVIKHCYKALHNMEEANEETGSYYGCGEVWSEQGYLADESAGYTITHKACVDRRGEPIRIKLHLPYNNITNSKVSQSIFDASAIEFADKIFTAQPNGENGYYGVCLQNCTPINGTQAADLYTVGFTKAGTMRVYQNSATTQQLLQDTVVDAMGVSGVLIQDGQVCNDAYFEKIPNYNVQTSRIAMGQNAQTKEVIILCCGKENTVNMNGLTSKAVANILLGLGCTIAVEVAEGANSGMLDKGQMMYCPDENTVPENYCYWYISRACFYKNDFQKQLGELFQRYGANMWETYLQGKQLGDLSEQVEAEIENLTQALDDHIAEAEATYVKKSGDTMTGALDMSGNNVNNVSAVTSSPIGQLNLYSNERVNLNTGNGIISAQSKRIQFVAKPKELTDAATKMYVDNADSALRASVEENSGDISSNTIRITALEESVSGWTAALASMQTTVANLQETVNQNNVLLAQIIAGEADINYVRKTGDTLSGALDMGGNSLNNVSAVTSSPTAGLNLFSNDSVNLNNGSGSIVASGKRIQNVGNPTADGDAANKLYVDTVESSLQAQIDENNPEGNYLPLSGGILTGDVNFNNHNIWNLRNITGHSDNNLNISSANTVVLNQGEGLISAANKKIENVATPVSNTDAANKQYVDNAVAGVNPEGAYLPLSGGTMSGNINLNGNQLQNVSNIIGIPGRTLSLYSDTNVNLASGNSSLTANNKRLQDVGEPIANNDATTKNYVDNAVSGINPAGKYLPLTGGTLTGGLTVPSLTGSSEELAITNVVDMRNNKISNLARPTENSDAVTKSYVDDINTTLQGQISDVDPDGHYLPLTGGVMKGIVNFGSYTVGGLNQLISGTGMLTLNASTMVNLNEGAGGISANSKRVQYVSNPTQNTDAANKQYVDTNVSTVRTIAQQAANDIDNLVETTNLEDYSAKIVGTVGKLFAKDFTFSSQNPSAWNFGYPSLVSYVHNKLGNVAISIDGVVSSNSLAPIVFVAKMQVTDSAISFSDVTFNGTVPAGTYGIIVHI